MTQQYKSFTIIQQGNIFYTHHQKGYLMRVATTEQEAYQFIDHYLLVIHPCDKYCNADNCLKEKEIADNIPW